MSVANKKKEECCGCNACAEICPQHCIRMKEDSKGFFYPRVDVAVCIECGACENVCPFDTTNLLLRAPLKAYAAWNKIEAEHTLSSSGGVAYVFSSYILGKNGVVYGCAANGIEVRHIRVDSISELRKLQGSKYVQSDVQGMFRQVKKDLQQQRPVLFIGTPCQVAGLKNYIRTVPPHLYLVDLICHGVPSLKMLSEHVSQISNGREVLNISFRRGTAYLMEFSCEDFSYECHYWKDAYMRMFVNGFISRPSCYNCPYANLKRTGDVSIGDFWGLGKMDERPKGANDAVSVLLPCNEKGLRLIKTVAGALVLYERQVQEAVSGNPQLQHPTLRTRRCRIFNIFWPLLPFNLAVWLCLSDQLIAAVKRKIFTKWLCNGFRK